MTRLTAALIVIGLLGAPPAARAQTPDERQAMMAAGTQSLVFRAFCAVDWGATELVDSPNTFAIGQFDLFLASTLDERISVLAEVVLEGGTETEVVTDLERLLITYRVNDNLQVSAGRYHTGIGFYNAAFHHAAFFETPTGRPRIYLFEDEGGVLPVKEVGLTVRGSVPGTSSALRYLAEVGNGRRWIEPESDEDRRLDENDAKAVNFGVSYAPDLWRGVEIGGSHYRDTIPREDATSVDFQLTAAYLTYRTPSIEILAEWLWLRHSADGVRYDNDAAYVQVSKAWGRLRPYYRYDRQTVDPSTPLIGDAGSYRAHIVGLRFDPSELVGLKAQYEHGDDRGQQGVDSVRAQVVFVF